MKCDAGVFAYDAGNSPMRCRHVAVTEIAASCGWGAVPPRRDAAFGSAGDPEHQRLDAGLTPSVRIRSPIPATSGSTGNPKP